MEVSKQALPHRRTLRGQGLPQGQRAPDLRGPPGLARRRSPSTSTTHQLGRDDLLFATTAGTPISRNTFRTRVWQPAVKASGVGFAVRMHDLRHAHASWLLAGGSDLASVMDRLGHAHIQTTEKYLHAPAEADQKNLAALDRIRGSGSADKPRPGSSPGSSYFDLKKSGRGGP